MADEHAGPCSDNLDDMNDLFEGDVNEADADYDAEEKDEVDE